MTGVLLSVAGAVVSVLAFPRLGPGWLILVGIILFFGGLRTARSRRHGLLIGSSFGLVFYGGLLWWLSQLGLIAVTPLVLSQAAFVAVYGWWLAGHNHRPAHLWYLLAVGGWAVMEMIRYRFPVHGFEWGALGYALSDQTWARSAAPLIGTSGITVLVVVVAVAVVALVTAPRRWWMWLAVGSPLVVALLVAVYSMVSMVDRGGGYPVAIVQGSTPCPFEHCPDERLRTFEQHLDLTRTIEPGSVSLVIWSEGSTGSTNADPVNNPEIGAAIGAEARRIGAWFLVGSDRPVDDENWVNANVLFDPQGEIVDEYRKQHPVPFGEYIPMRPLFEWIPALDQVPRDMIPGDRAVVFDLDDGIRVGSVISFEGGFSRYLRQEVAAGANVLAVLTNEGSYGTTPGSDQFIGMTRMRASELGLDLIHAAVTGKSVVIGSEGEFRSRESGLGTEEVVLGEVWPRDPSPYARTGDVLMIVFALAGVVAWATTLRRVVGSRPRILEEEQSDVADPGEPAGGEP